MRWRVLGQRLLRRGAAWLRDRADRILARLPVLEPDDGDRDGADQRARSESERAREAPRAAVRPGSTPPAHWLARSAPRPPRSWLERVEAARRRFRLIWIDSSSLRQPSGLVGEQEQDFQTDDAASHVDARPPAISPEVESPDENATSRASRAWMPPDPLPKLRVPAERAPMPPNARRRAAHELDLPTRAEARSAAAPESTVTSQPHDIPADANVANAADEGERGTPVSDTRAVPSATTEPPSLKARTPEPVRASHDVGRRTHEVPPPWPAFEVEPTASTDDVAEPPTGGEARVMAREPGALASDPAAGGHRLPEPYDVPRANDARSWLNARVPQVDEIPWSSLPQSRPSYAPPGRGETPSSALWPSLPGDPWPSSTLPRPIEYPAVHRTPAARDDVSLFDTAEDAARWPELPAPPPEEAADWRALKQTLDRLERLDREQRGW